MHPSQGASTPRPVSKGVMDFRAIPVQEDDENTNAKEEWSIKLQSWPSLEIIRLIWSKMKGMEHIVTNVNLKVDLPTDDQQKGETVNDIDHKAILVLDKHSSTDSASNAAAKFSTDAPVDPPAATSADHAVDPPQISSVLPIAPKKSLNPSSAVLRFVADDKVYCFGRLNTSTQGAAVQVFSQIKVPHAELPNFGIRVRFPRDKSSNTKARFSDERFHNVWYRFNPQAHIVDDHLVTDEAEFQDSFRMLRETVTPKLRKPCRETDCIASLFHMKERTSSKTSIRVYTRPVCLKFKTFSRLWLLSLTARLSRFSCGRTILCVLTCSICMRCRGSMYHVLIRTCTSTRRGWQYSTYDRHDSVTEYQRHTVFNGARSTSPTMRNLLTHGRFSGHIPSTISSLEMVSLERR